MATAIGTYATTANVKARMGITNATDDTVIGKTCDAVNAWIEGPEGAQRVLAPIASADYFFNGYDAVDDGHVLYVPNGIRGITTLQVAPTTNGTLVSVPAADWMLEPSPQRRTPGWPAVRVRIKDLVTGGVPYFFPGYENIKFVGATLGWAAMPDDVVDIAEATSVRIFQSRRTGQSDIVGSDELGRPLISRLVSARDRATLQAYRLPSIS